MTQQDLATRMRVSNRTVSGWCLGERRPHRESRDRLAEIFQRDPDWFTDEHGFRESE